MEFRTQVAGVSVEDADITDCTSEETLVLAIRKSEGNPFPERISIGRALNCDLVIRDPAISKLHGHFRESTERSTWFTDTNSSNGTTIENRKLLSGTATLLEEWQHISFGNVRFQLLSPVGVHGLF